MSLLITSNTALPDEGIGSGIGGLNKPSSYTNNLQGTLKIPINSQIAVQSVKLNKTGNVVGSEGLSMGFYFGREFNPGEDSDFFDQTSYMTQDNIGEPGKTYDEASLAVEAKKTLNKLLWHPNLLENASAVINPGASCIVKRNASGDFAGFEFRATNSSSGNNELTNLNTAGTWKDTQFGSNIVPTFIGDVLTHPPTSQRTTAAFIGTAFPLSLAGGQFNCSLGNSSLLTWSVGLSRCQRQEDYEGVAADLTTPSYFTGDGTDFYDYVLRQEIVGASHIIKAYHCIATGGDDVSMEEIALPGAPIDGIAETIVAVKWEVNGEKVSCAITKANGSVINLIDGVGTPAKPINMMCRFLFPKVTLERDKNVSIKSFNGVAVKDFVYGDAPAGATSEDDFLYKDYWAYLQNNQQEDEAEYYETYNDTNQEVDGGFSGQIGLSSGLIAYPTGGIKLGFEENTETDDDGDLFGYKFSEGLNSAVAMGFANNGTPSPAALTVPWVWTSSVAPVTKNTNSLFIRLKNMTFDSANFSTSNMSKILYHIPAFSNNGESTGSLFFEPSERVYLDLNNPTEMFLTTVEVDIVNSNETISNDLLGKTVVVFHIQDKK